MVDELKAELKSGRGIAVGALLKDIHDAVRGLRSEIDLSGESPWAKQLAALAHRDFQAARRPRSSLMPGRVRRLMRPRPAKEIAPGSALDADEVAEAEALIGFVMACRNYASELAISEITQRTFTELQQYLDTGTAHAARCACGSPATPSGRSGSRRSMRRCASAARCSARNMPRCWPRRAEVASHGERKAAPRLTR